MRKLILRMVREIKYHVGQFISILLIIAIGSAIFSGMLGAILSIQKSIPDYYEKQNLAELWVTVNNVTTDQIEELNYSEKLVAEGRYTLSLDVLVQGEEAGLLAHSLTDINSVYLREGELPASINECVVDSKFAKANELSIGDTIKNAVVADSNSTENPVEGRDLLITGIGDSPENAYKVKDGASVLVSQKSFGIVYCTGDTIIELMKSSPAYLGKKQEILKKYGEGQMAETALKKLDNETMGYRELLVKSEDTAEAVEVIKKQPYYISCIEKEEQVSYSMVQGGIDTISTVSYIFPVVFFVVAALVLLISMSKMVENQRMQIAVIEAIGISKGKIRLGYVFYSAMVSLFGAVPFAIFGHKLISRVIIHMFSNRFSVGEITSASGPFLVLIPFTLILLLSSLAAILAVGGVLRLVPAQAMRPKPPKKSKIILVERMTGLWRRLGYSTKLILRNLCLNKTRVLISSIGIISSVMLLLTGLSLQSSASKLLQLKREGINYDLSVVYNTPIQNATDLSFHTDVAAIELTKTLKATLPDLNNLSTSIQILPQDCGLVLLKDLRDNVLTIGQESVIIPHTLAKDYGISVGDRIKLMVEGKSIDVTVTDISAQYIGSVIYLSDKVAAAVELEYSYNTAMLKLSESDKANKLKEELLQEDRIKAVNTKADISGAAAENLELLNVIIYIIIAASVIMSVAVIYNITSINLFERAREFATLMVLGYYKHEVGKLLFTENLVITVLGCAGGLPCGMILYKALLDSIKNSGVILPEAIPIQSIILSFGITFIFSIITNIIMKKKIGDIDMIEALKGVE